MEAGVHGGLTLTLGRMNLVAEPPGLTARRGCTGFRLGHSGQVSGLLRVVVQPSKRASFSLSVQ